MTDIHLERLQQTREYLGSLQFSDDAETLIDAMLPNLLNTILLSKGEVPLSEIRTAIKSVAHEIVTARMIREVAETEIIPAIIAHLDANGASERSK